MKDRPELVALVCRGHCRFFQPDRKEELACAGYGLISRRASAETVSRWDHELAGAIPPGKCDHDPRIERLICDQCEFRADGCDFMARPQAGPVPCGGYVLLRRLLDRDDPEALKWFK